MLTEHEEQVNVFRWAGDCASYGIYPELALMFAIPNVSYGGTRRDLFRGMKLKAEGRKAGVPDIFLPVPRGDYCGLFVEMKKIGGAVNAIQKDWIKELNEQGYLAIVCYGCQEAIAEIEKYLNT